MSGVLALHVLAGQTMSFERFCAEPGPAVALDGFVPGPPCWEANRHWNFNHHEGVDRLTTRATCEQVALAIRMGLFSMLCPGDGTEPVIEVYVNDADADVCLSVWLLEHPGLVDDPAVVRLVAAEGMLDVTGGTSVPTTDPAFLDELCWVFAPYDDARAAGVAGSDSEVVKIIAEVGDRIDAHLSGRGGRRLASGHYRVLARDGQVAVVREYGPLARARMRADGIGVFVSVRETKDHRIVSVGKTGPYVAMDLEAVWERLNRAEGCVGAERWGGGDSIGGSPRRGGTRLPVGVIMAAVVGPQGTAAAELAARLAVAALA